MGGMGGGMPGGMGGMGGGMPGGGRGQRARASQQQRQVSLLVDTLAFCTFLHLLFVYLCIMRQTCCSVLLITKQQDHVNC